MKLSFAKFTGLHCGRTLKKPHMQLSLTLIPISKQFHLEAWYVFFHKCCLFVLFHNMNASLIHMRWWYMQIDRSIIESFGDGGRACITSRAYPLFATDKDAHLFVFNDGSQSVVISQLNAWSMKQAEFGTESII